MKDFVMGKLRYVLVGVIGTVLVSASLIAHADITNPHPTPPSNSVTNAMLQQGIILDGNVASGAAINLTKLSQTGDVNSVVFGKGLGLGTSTNLTFNSATNTFSSLGTTVLGTNVTINGVAYTFTGSVGGTNTVLTNNGSGGLVWQSATPPPLGILGNAADGNCTFTTTVNLTKDEYCGNVTVSGTVFTDGWKIFATGTVEVQNGGKISVDGRVGQPGGSGGGSGGAAGLAATSTGMLGIGTNGFGGAAPNTGGGGSGVLVVDALGGSGGEGGVSPATGQFSLGGFASSTLARFLDTVSLMSLSPYSTTTNQYVRANGGAGGGGGGGGNGANGAGGGGGGGAGVLAIFAQNVLVDSGGTISAIGGRGGDGGTANGMAGGGGGGGGLVIGYTVSYTNNGTVSAAGGPHGTDAGGGAASQNGSNGTMIIERLQ